MNTNTRFTISNNRVENNGFLMWQVTDHERNEIRFYRTKKNALAAIESVKKSTLNGIWLRNYV